MIQQSYFWLFSQKNWNQVLKEMLVTPMFSRIIYNNQDVEKT